MRAQGRSGSRGAPAGSRARASMIAVGFASFSGVASLTVVAAVGLPVAATADPVAVTSIAAPLSASRGDGILASLASPASLAPAGVPVAGPPVFGTPASSRRNIDHVALHACGDGASAYCGELERPLDPDGDIPDKIPIYFEFYLHTAAGRPKGTLVATEGGPGYPATGSRDDYLALFKPLMSDHDVLIMDNRGTGRSGAVDCHELQTGQKWTVESVAACGESLGPRAPLYSTTYAADDLAAILKALDVAKIDLYGDSYGTYFEQVFALRHPDALRSMVLDGAYPLTGPDYAWYPTYAPAMRTKFNLACSRSAECAALPGDSIAHIMPALTELRAHPFASHGVDADGNERRFEANASQLAIVMFGSAPAATTVREVDAAARAFAGGDRLPLLRLMAETAAAVDSRDPSANPALWSAGLAAAVMCQDPPQIFDMRLPPPARRLDHDRALAARRRAFPETYAPFTIDEYRAMPLDYSFIDQCVGWPVSPPNHPASQVGAEGTYPDVPALVISGELDNLTTMADGAAVAAAFKRGVQVRIANSFHVNALPRARSDCAAGIVRRFIRTLSPGDAAGDAAGDGSCASRVPPLHLVPRFARHSQELEPAAGLPGNTASSAELRAVSAAVLTAGDVLARVNDDGGHGAGLRGGVFRWVRTGAAVHVTLDRVRWVDDIAVSGALERSEDRRGVVHATLQLSAANGEDGQVTLKWRAGLESGTVMPVRGAFGTARIVATSPVP